MSKVWQHRNDLILMAEGCDEWTDKVTSSEIVEQVELVHYSYGTTCDVDLLDGNVMRLPLSFLWGPLCLIIPVVLIVVIEQVFCFVDRRECS
jgi:hypothetical protein